MIDRAYGHKDYTCLQKTRLRKQDIRHGADKRIATGGTEKSRPAATGSSTAIPR